MTWLDRMIADIAWYWRKTHPSLTRLPAWRKAHEAEQRARRRNCTKAIGQARKAKSAALHADMRGKAGA